MKLINANTFVTSLMTLTAVVIPVVSNAQFVPVDCSSTQNIDRQIGIESNTQSTTCVRDTADTIYNPNPNWLPSL